MKVPFLELKPAYDEPRGEFDAAYHWFMDSGWYLLGNEIESFESGFAKYCEAGIASPLAMAWVHSI